MDIEEVKTRIQDIMRNDDTESFHIDEDKLMHEFIEEVSKRNDLPFSIVNVAKEIVKLNKADRSRWYS